MRNRYEPKEILGSRLGSFRDSSIKREENWIGDRNFWLSIFIQEESRKNAQSETVYFI